MATEQQSIDAFLDGAPHAVVGASADRNKYGNKVLRAYMEQRRPVQPVNPNADEVEGLHAYSALKDLPERPHGVSIITPPDVTERIVDEAAAQGIEHVWMQPGAESEKAIEKAKGHGMNVIAGGPCVLIEFGFGG
jgi:predicted CoA-binding protein